MTHGMYHMLPWYNNSRYMCICMYAGTGVTCKLCVITLDCPHRRIQWSPIGPLLMMDDTDTCLAYTTCHTIGVRHIHSIMGWGVRRSDDMCVVVQI
jgi:hypothetical protein